MHFIGIDKQPECVIVIDVPVSSITLNKEPASRHLKGQFSYHALIKDQNGAVVKEFSGEQAVDLPPSQVGSTRASHFIYTQHSDLAPGSYHLETLVTDMNTGAVSTRTTTFSMPESDGHLALSSVAMVRNLRENSNGITDDDPFLMGSKVVVPVIAASLKKSDADLLRFYLVVYPDPNTHQKPGLAMTFFKDGKALATESPELGSSDAKGRIQYVAAAPITQLQPGNYEVRFTAKQGSETAVEIVRFTLEQ